jgi:hypothetical protein
MTFRTASLLLFTIAFGLVGCRDALVDEPLPVDNPPADEQDPPAESSSAAPIYLKGPAELPLGATGNYRAEFASGAVTYEWLATGEGHVTGRPSSSQGLPRFYDITGVNTGSVQLTVRAVGPNNELLGLASRTITITE